MNKKDDVNQINKILNEVKYNRDLLKSLFSIIKKYLFDYRLIYGYEMVLNKTYIIIYKIHEDGLIDRVDVEFKPVSLDLDKRKLTGIAKKIYNEKSIYELTINYDSLFLSKKV
jgi:hypothetical protein